MQIRVRKGISIKTVEVDSICSCNGHAVAQRVNSNCKIDYYIRDAGSLFWSARPCKKQDTNAIKVIRRLI